jgi:hypothetical protein
MVILTIFILWIVVLYIIKLNREIYEFKKYYSQHKDIYVPSYKEIIDNNLWYIQFFNFIKAQIRNRNISKIKNNPGFAIANSEENDN